MDAGSRGLQEGIVEDPEWQHRHDLGGGQGSRREPAAVLTEGKGGDAAAG